MAPPTGTRDHPIDLSRHETVANAEIAADSTAITADGLAPDIGLRIIRLPPDEGGHFDFFLWGPLLPAGASGISRKTATDVFGAVEECRKEWAEAVVKHSRFVDKDGKRTFEKTFEAAWDFQKEADLLPQLVPRLAVAGDKLFKAIFERDCDDRLRQLSGALRARIREPRHIAITSGKFYLPWSMLYTHPVGNKSLLPDGSNWDKRGFWGYQHIVQHSPETFTIDSRIKPSATGEVALSVNFDDRLPTALKLPDINKHINHVAAFGCQPPIRRTTKQQLATVFTQGRETLERILYFYCHGDGSSSGGGATIALPCLKFSDGDISASDFKYWAGTEKLPTNPLVMINACQGGQMSTLFYESFANELLSQGAIGLIGAQIDVPAVFANGYGQHLFDGFFVRNGKCVRLGPLMREINRRMWDDHHNPLGLVYSLYRGVDCFIDWPQTV